MTGASTGKGGGKGGRRKSTRKKISKVVTIFLFKKMAFFSFYRTSMSTLTFLSKKLSLASYLAKIPVFHPTHTFRILWDLLNLAIVILLLFVIPINVFFEVDLMEGYGEARKMVETFFLVDVLVNLNTAYYSKVC